MGTIGTSGEIPVWRCSRFVWTPRTQSTAVSSGRLPSKRCASSTYSARSVCWGCPQAAARWSSAAAAARWPGRSAASASRSTPSAAATALAEAADDGSVARYRTAPPDELGVPDGSADLVYCADTFEITDDLDAVLHEVARALRPGGVLVYDTVTRTVVSRLVYLGGFQGIPATRIMPPGRYAAARLRPPEELVPALARHGLVSGDVCSFEPQSRRALVSAVLARRRGQITDADVPSALRFELAPGHRPVVTYLGFARKPAS
jgi:2-polyprenyl-6-hydroxyphenyl methylase / 3-demethylubiquinone-9 3-methyltransferase